MKLSIRLRNALVFAFLMVAMLIPAKMGMGQKFVAKSAFGTYGTSDSQFNTPSGTAVMSNGDILVTDYYNNRIVQFNSLGVFVKTIGNKAGEPGLSGGASFVAVDKTDNIYVTSYVGNAVQVFDKTGLYKAQWQMTGKLQRPRGIAISPAGEVYVACELTGTVEQYTLDGQFVAGFGSLGTEDSQFQCPVGLAIANNGDIVVGDYVARKVKRFSPSGGLIWSIPTQGNVVPQGVACTWEGQILVTYTDVPYPMYLSEDHTSGIQMYAPTGHYTETIGSNGSALGQLDVPCGIAVTPAGRMVVAEQINHRVSVFAKRTGKVVSWGALAPPLDNGNFVQFDIGTNHGIALKENGTVVCWGDNGFGKSNVPAGLTNVVQVKAGSNYSLVLKDDGTVVGWGHGWEFGSKTYYDVSPKLTNARKISAGIFDAAAILADGRVVNWFEHGTNWHDPDGIVDVAGGVHFMVALRGNGTILWWHLNPGVDVTSYVAGFANYTNVRQVVPGAYSSVVLSTNGLLELKSKDSRSPSYLTDVVEVAGDTEAFHSLVRKSNGQIVGWGANPSGQLDIPVLSGEVIQMSVGLGISAVLIDEYIEPLPPTSTFSPSSGNNWLNSNVTATITSTDNAGGSGVKEVHYSVNMGTEQVITGSSASFTVSDEGVYSIAYWAVDNAGNIEATKYGSVRIDKTAPSIDGYVLSGKLTLLASDGRSGVAAIKYSLDGAAAVTYTSPLTIPAGAHTYTFYSVDNAGNESVKETILVGATVSVTLLPTSVYASKSSVATIKLSVAAPVGGVTVMLASSNPAVTIAPSVKLNAGATSINVPVQTGAVAADTSAVITATVGGIESYATLVVMVPYPKTLVISPNVITGGNTATGTVSLQSAAPVGGQLVTLTSMHPDVTVPSTVTVLAGALSANFTVTTKVASKDYSAAIYAEADDAGIGTTVLVKRVTPKSVTFAPSSIVGGNTSVGTVTLNVAAPVGGATVILKSTSPLVMVPTSVSFAEGQTTATFDISTSITPRTILASIQAAAAGVKVSGVLTVSGLNVLSVTLAPNSVLGGTSTTGSVNLNTNAPAGGVTVQLYTTSSIAGVPVSVTVPAGQKTGTFTVTTSPVSANALVQVVGKFLGVAKPATLTVQAAAVTTVTLNPTSVKGGTNSTMTIKLSGLAGPSGLVVTLTSSNIIAATVPTTVTVPAGTDTVDVAITTKVVTANATSTMTAKTGAGSKTAVLTVTK